MRSALGLMLASVMTAVVIAAVWFWTASPKRVEVAAPNTVAVPLAERLAAVTAAKPLARRDDVEFTAAIPEKPAAAPQLN